MFYLGTLLWTITCKTASHITEKLLKRGKGELGYIGVFAEKNTLVKRITTKHKKQTTQVNDFSH